MQLLNVNFERIKRDLNELLGIGQAPDGGIYRVAFSDADMEARFWLERKIGEFGMHAYHDGAANVFGRRGEHEGRPAILIGSHLDSVPGGGNLDGGLGVVIALECLRRFKEENLDGKYDLEVVAFSDEEGRFGGPFGSLALSGSLTPEILNSSVDLHGIPLKAEMARHGLDVNDALHARRNPSSVHAFMELHIEQGPVLDAENMNVGVVGGITGLFKWVIRLIGEADHAGTTPMKMRHDAFSGLSEFSGEIPRILEEDGTDDSVATIGKIDLFPGSANVVPSQVEFSLDVRDIDGGVLKELAYSFRKTLSAIARRRSLMFEFDIISEIDPINCDKKITGNIRDIAKAMNIRWRDLHSGAVHDAQIMSRIAPVGMVFVPSKDGRSHSPAEWTHWEDIEIGANLFLNSVIKTAGIDL